MAETIYCSFCFKSNHEVVAIVKAGDTYVAICDECIVSCYDLTAEVRAKSADEVAA